MSAVSNRLDETEMRAVKWRQSFIIKAFHSEPPSKATAQSVQCYSTKKGQRCSVQTTIELIV